MTKSPRPAPEPPFPGALTAAEAARIAQKTKAAITHAIRVGALKAIKEEGIRGRVWIDVMDLRETFPPHKRGSQKHRVFRLSHAVQDQIIGFAPNVNGAERRPREIEGMRDEE